MTNFSLLVKNSPNLPSGYETAWDCGYTWWKGPNGEWTKEGIDYSKAILECWAHYVGPRAFKPNLSL